MNSRVIRLIRLELLAGPSGRYEHRVVHLHSSGRAFVTGGSPAWEPPADLYETENHLVVEVNLAGIQPAVVRIEMTPRYLQLSGSRPEQAEDAQRAYHLLEIERGVFARSIKLPVPVEPSSAQVAYADGLLTIRLIKVAGGYLYACNAADSTEGLE